MEKEDRRFMIFEQEIEALKCENILLKLELSQLRFKQEMSILEDIKHLNEKVLLNSSKMAQLYEEISQIDKEIKEIMENIKSDDLFDENGELIK